MQTEKINHRTTAKKSDFSFDNTDSTGFLLWQVTNLWQREIKKALEKFDLTHSQFALLACVHWLTLEKQEATQILLSNHTKIDPMTTSTVLKTLHKKGLIKRQEHQTDTRAKTVTLTELGLKNTRQAIKTVEQFDRHFFGVIDKQLTRFNQNLTELIGNEK